MIIEQLGPAACRSYVVGCARAGRAILVDPLAADVERVVAQLDSMRLALDLVVDSHTHADHHSGGREVARRTGAPYALHAATTCTGVDERLADGQVLEVGHERVEVLHTPGHTPDSITLRAGNRLLTGDFLFLAQDGAGRLDLPGGDAEAHWDSLQRLAAFDDEHHVLPGHDYNELPGSTLGVERRRNPRFQNVTREEYATWQRAVASPTPQWMLDVIAANLGSGAAHAAHHASAPLATDPLAINPAAVDPMAACAPGVDGGGRGGGGGGGGACAAGPLDAVPLVFPEEAARRTNEGGVTPPFFLDVREPWEYGGPMGCHAPGTHLIPLAQLPARLDELPADPEHEVLIICKSGGRSAHAAAWLIAQGRRRVFNVATGTDGWVQSGLPVER